MIDNARRDRAVFQRLLDGVLRPTRRVTASLVAYPHKNNAVKYRP